MAWCNSYAPRASVPLSDTELNGSEPYDLNFCLPINVDVLKSDRVKLTPFIPRQHADILFRALEAHPELYEYLPLSLPKTSAELLTTCELMFRRDPACTIFAVIDKTRPGLDKDGLFVGTIGFVRTTPQHLSTELGFVLVFPPYQRTHVATNAIGILLNYCLNLPSDPVMPGLGLRRVQWQANTRNAKSIRAAERMGFRREGTMLWSWALPEGDEGYATREDDPMPSNLGRHSAYLAVNWVDWESGVKQKVAAAMDRRS